MAKKTAKKKTRKAQEEAPAEVPSAPTPPATEPVTPAAEAPKERRSGRSAAKKQAALAVVLRSTSDRMAEMAEASVWAVSSEKTIDQFQAIEQQAEDAEESRMERLVDVEVAMTPPAELRRSSRDPFVAFRAELARPEEDPSDPHASWRQASNRLRHELNPGARPDELAAFERQIGHELPPSYFDFALEWNGGLLYVQRDGGYRVLPVSELLSEIKGPLCGGMSYPFLPAVDLSCGDYLALDMSKTNRSGENPLYWWHAGEPRKKVAESFGGWLKRLVETGGDPYWWEL